MFSLTLPAKMLIGFHSAENIPLSSHVPPNSDKIHYQMLYISNTCFFTKMLLLLGWKYERKTENPSRH
jgi:hypothetical protein